MERKNKGSLSDSKYDKIMCGLNIWIGYYRANPVRFLIDYYGMEWIRPFQQVLITFMFRFNNFMTIASRGMGKSMIVAAFLCAYCTLYPGVKVCIAAGQRGQSINVLLKIVEEFMPQSPNLRNEILKTNTSPSEGFIYWKNGSVIKVVTARDSARSARANIIIMDEFRLIDKGVVDKVLRKFKAGQRRPNFYNKEEYSDKVEENKAKYPKEPNKEIYLSSAYYKYHWSWAKFKAFFKSMIKGESYMVVGFPYQLPVYEGYYPEEQIREEMQEDDFDSIAWSMEMDSLFFGSSEKAFYNFETVDKIRKIQRALYPKPYYALLNDSKYKYEPKRNGEIRLLSMDIATQGGSKNDATCFTLMQLLPTSSNQYIRNVLYITTLDGGHTFDQALKARRLFEDFDCDYIIVDTNGVGIGVFDNLVIEQVDDERNTVYPAWSCINNDKMAERCKDPEAEKVIYSIKATAKFNSDAAVYLRDCIKRGKLRLLINEIDSNDILNRSKAFQNLLVEDQVMFQEPFYQTTAMIKEMINLDYTATDGKIKVVEVAGMRKDRYSSISYANYIANELERDMRNIEDEYGFSTFIN